MAGVRARDAARLGVEADHIDIRDFVRTGIQGAVTLNGGMTQTVDRRGYGLVELRSRGDLRFLSSTAATPASLPFGGFPSAGAMLASGDLLLAAQRIYPATGSAGLAVAGVRDANTFDPERALRVQRVEGSCPPSRRCRRSAGWRSWRRWWQGGVAGRDTTGLDRCQHQSQRAAAAGQPDVRQRQGRDDTLWRHGRRIELPAGATVELGSVGARTASATWNTAWCLRAARSAWTRAR